MVIKKDLVKKKHLLFTSKVETKCALIVCLHGAVMFVNKSLNQSKYETIALLSYSFLFITSNEGQSELHCLIDSLSLDLIHINT